MLKLDPFEQELYEVAYAGKRWTYVARAAGDQFALAIVVVGRPGKTEIPTDICCSDDFEEIRQYAKSLNVDRNSRIRTGEQPAVQDVA